jgi:CelD/BcsL family acetyltransferase involved in cellulose biosynthesis
MDIVQGLDETQWREFVDNHPQAQIFHTPEMFQVFARAKGHRPTLWAAVDSHTGPLALLLPVQVTLMGRLLRRATTRAIAYGGVLCAPGPQGQAALGTLLRTYTRGAKSSALFTELRNLTDVSDLQPVLNGTGFAYEDHLNYLVDLDRSPELILQGIGPRTRKKIRRALREGEVVIEEADRREQVELCYALLQKTYAAAQVPLADWSLFEAAYDILHPKGMVKFLLACIDGEYAAGSVELIYKEGIYGWYGGMDRTYTDRIPNELLLWHIFRWGAEHGYKVYDFGGAGKPTEEYGVRDFKAKFGGNLVCFGRNTCIHAPRLLWLSRQAYRWLRRYV